MLLKYLIEPNGTWLRELFGHHLQFGQLFLPVRFYHGVGGFHLLLNWLSLAARFKVAS